MVGMSLGWEDVCAILTFTGIKRNSFYCNMQIIRLSRKKKASEEKPKHLFLSQVNRSFCLLSRNLGYAIQQIVSVLLCSLRVVGLWQWSLCNVTTPLVVEVLVGVDVGRQIQQQKQQQQQRWQDDNDDENNYGTTKITITSTTMIITTMH